MSKDNKNNKNLNKWAKMGRGIGHILKGVVDLSSLVVFVTTKKKLK